ncbi:MAG: hypothetical protein MMC23_000971 [Stictis urceolatum]|nr:hypothetical protein [Stictis urceolata]
MLARTAKPKLSLSVPTLNVHAAPKSPSPFVLPVSPSPITPTARNTQMNQRGLATLQVPVSQARKSSAAKKSVQFATSPSVRLVSPMPKECYGEYVKMSREERRWTARN